MASDRERHFVLHLMNFVYNVSGKPLQFCLQEMLSEFPKEKESYFSKNIAKAVSIHITDYLDFMDEENLVDLASPAYQIKIEELLSMYDPYDFLKFLSHYALKSIIEYYKNGLLDSPVKFFSSIVRFLEEIRKKDISGVEFWECLDEAAAEVIANDIEVKRNRNEKDIDMTLETEFILVATNTIYGFYYKPLPDYLRRRLDEFLMISLNEFDPNIDIALKIIKENLQKRINFLGDDKAIYEHLFNLTKSSFNGRYFLEFCVCCTRRGLVQYISNGFRDQGPLRAYECLLSALELAKRDGKFSSIEAFTHGANEIIEDERERTRQGERAPSDASTEYFGYIPNKPSSEYENLITSCERARIATRLASIISDENAQLVAENVITSFENLKLTTGNVIISDENATLAAENEIVSAENAQLAAENLIVYCENTQLAVDNIRESCENVRAIENVIASGENAYLPQQNVIASGEKGQPEMESVVISSEIGQPIMENINSENSQAATEKVVTSNESTQQAGESEDFIASDENTTKGSCRCCTTI